MSNRGGFSQIELLIALLIHLLSITTILLVGKTWGWGWGATAGVAAFVGAALLLQLMRR